MSAITAKASRKMKKYAVLTREPRCFLGSFDFSWEQRKFSELVQIERGGSTRPIDDFITDTPNGLNWIKIGDAPTQGNYITKTAEKIRPEGLSKTREVHPGDLILSNSMSFGKPYIMGIDGCIHDGWLLIRNTYGVFDLTFLCHLLGTPQMLSQYRSLAAGSTVNNLNKELVGNTVVTIPSITEQRVLGDYLEQLDNLITLHQRKCALLFSHFQALISMMFTTSTFSWEQRKVSELFRVTRGYVLAATQTETTKTDEKPYPVYSSQTKDKGLMGYYKDYLYEDAITWTTDGANAGTVNYRAGKFYCTNVCGVLLSNEVKANQMIAEALNSVAKGYVSYVGNPKLMNNVMADIVIQIPTQAEEREQLSSFFAKLDNLITLHQRKCISFTGRAGRLISTVNKKRITSSWEQRKLGDMMNVTSVKRIHQSDWTDSGVRFLRARDIVAAAKNEEPDDYLYISKEKYEEYSALSGKVGVSDLLVTGVGTIGVPYLVRNLEPLYFKDGNIIWFQNSDKIDGKFLFYSFSAEQIQGFINESAGIGTVGTYTIESGKKTPISLPNQIEQAKVGDFFQQLDNLITLHQRKPFLMKWRNSDANRNQTNRLVL